MREHILSTITDAEFSSISKCAVDTISIYEKLLDEGRIDNDTCRSLLGDLFIIISECGFECSVEGTTIPDEVIEQQKKKLQL